MPERTYDHWQTMLRGERADYPAALVQPGRYRFRMNRNDLPEKEVAVYIDPAPENPEHLAVLINRLPLPALLRGDAAEEDFAFNKFQYMARKPISAAVADHWYKTGEWPDTVQAATNLPNDTRSPDAQLQERLDALKANFDHWCVADDGLGGGVATTQDQADKAANFKVRFAELEKEAIESHRAEKAPVIEEGKNIDLAWFPIRDAGKALKAQAADLVAAFLRAEQVRKAEAALEAAKRGAKIDAKALKASAASGRPGAGVRLVTWNELTITNLTAFIEHYNSDDRFNLHPDASKLRGKLAIADLQAGKEVPGVSLKIDSKAV